jgi:hypothetical protein
MSCKEFKIREFKRPEIYTRYSIYYINAKLTISGIYIPLPPFKGGIKPKIPSLKYLKINH